ncbi:dihydrodipicolinate synthase family protein [Terrimonas sp. NA20]|uniref:Dihydrodipicolinate synthase family protein n=1 Tax=Terrimonas ginsenosidimutans TaxID=2908004 RepID=A0ABS9KMY7_9BACT|nr:dihydrodipicolinate synthase family protein [Terrimonas ginsenosidimutans]MCG2613678.1 dihydrodipicolinate synthase family protein [Terrimonas ginsenosidimutans]
MPVKGKFVPVMLTPFDKTGKIDYDALAKLTAYYIDAGATGLFANCLSSEMFELLPDERSAVTSFVVKEAAGAVPVFSTGTFDGSLQQQADFSKRIYDTGVDAVVAITSILASEHEADDTLIDRVEELFSLTDGIPFGFYECPVPYKRVLSSASLQRIVRTGRVVYYKDTSLDIDAVTEKVKLTAHNSSFELYDAYMVNAVASLTAGCAGLSCIQGNFVPELISWVVNNFDNSSKIDQVNAAQKFLVDSMDVMHDVYPIAAKYFLQSRGYEIDMNTRRSVGELSGSAMAKLDQLSQDYDQLLELLGIKMIKV